MRDSGVSQSPITSDKLQGELYYYGTIKAKGYGQSEFRLGRSEEEGRWVS